MFLFSAVGSFPVKHDVAVRRQEHEEQGIGLPIPLGPQALPELRKLANVPEAEEMVLRSCDEGLQGLPINHFTCCNPLLVSRETMPVGEDDHQDGGQHQHYGCFQGWSKRVGRAAHGSGQ